MVENTGNKYRTREAVVAAFVLIALAFAVIVYGATDTGFVGALSAFLIVAGIGIAVMSALFDSTPDKFGPSEMIYRLVFGILLLAAGLAGLMYKFDVSTYIIVAVVIIIIAVLGLCVALVNGKNSKY